MVVFCVNAMEAKGYDAEICMDETLKEIHSRKGAFNPELNKLTILSVKKKKKQSYPHLLSVES